MPIIDGRAGWQLRAAALLAAALALPVQAADPSRFQVRNAYVEKLASSWQLNVRLDLALSPAAAAALSEGVPLTLHLEAEVHAARRFLPDEKVATLDQQWVLEFDAIADRYVVGNPQTSAQTSHLSLDEALQELARIRALPLAPEEALQPGRPHEVSVRAMMEIGGMPDAVKLLLFWRDWSRSTDWYTWSVQP